MDVQTPTENRKLLTGVAKAGTFRFKVEIPYPENLAWPDGLTFALPARERLR